ncbi:MAG: DUF427 domain-containing protein [Solirubrobacteraceae bacterium]
MTLTLGTGPLGRTDGHFNFDLAGASPAHRLFAQPYGLRVRATIAGTTVLDSDGAVLVHETGIPPRVYVPQADIHAALLERSDTSTHCPFKGDASYWSLTVDGRTIADAVWAYEAPRPESAWLAGLAALDPAHVDAWFVEGDRVVGGLRDPYHRVDTFAASRPVTVEIAGTVVARSERARLLAETGLPVRVYLPSVDVVVPVRPGSGRRTVCPYKGEATYWTVAARTDVAWSYELPLAEAAGVQGHLAFDDADDVVVRIG